MRLNSFNLFLIKNIVSGRRRWEEERITKKSEKFLPGNRTSAREKEDDCRKTARRNHLDARGIPVPDEEIQVKSLMRKLLHLAWGIRVTANLPN